MSTELPLKNQVWETLLECMQTTKDFVLEQAPDVLQQALRYEKISTWLNIATSAILLVIVFTVAYYFWKHPTVDKYESRDLLSTFGVFVPLLVSIPLFALFYDSIDRIIKIYAAPKYFLIDLLLSCKDG